MTLTTYVDSDICIMVMTLTTYVDSDICIMVMTLTTLYLCWLWQLCTYVDSDNFVLMLTRTTLYLCWLWYLSDDWHLCPVITLKYVYWRWLRHLSGESVYWLWLWHLFVETFDICVQVMTLTTFFIIRYKYNIIDKHLLDTSKRSAYIRSAFG